MLVISTSLRFEFGWLHNWADVRVTRAHCTQLLSVVWSGHNCGVWCGFSSPSICDWLTAVRTLQKTGFPDLVNIFSTSYGSLHKSPLPVSIPSHNPTFYSHKICFSNILPPAHVFQVIYRPTEMLCAFLVLVPPISLSLKRSS
jgi:hypothetical protein